MTIWNYVFDSEYKQRADIETLKNVQHKRGRRISRKLSKTEDRVAELEAQVGELALLCRTLLTILREDGTVQPERFEEVMQAIDLEDGVLDGQVTPEDQRPKPKTKPKAPKARKRRR